MVNRSCDHKNNPGMLKDHELKIAGAQNLIVLKNITRD